MSWTKYWKLLIPLLPSLALVCTGCATVASRMEQPLHGITLDKSTAVNPAFQAKVAAIDAELRAKHGMTGEQTAVGVLDLREARLAMVHPDRMEYAASIAKIGILLAYFELRPEAARELDATTRHELGLMIKASSNEMATKYSRKLGLGAIHDVLHRSELYDASGGGGIWMGKHYGESGERVPDPVGGFSHGATVRQLLRFYLLLEQGKLVSATASKTLREIFASPDIPHDPIKFVRALAGENVQIRRKWGSWETWLHDTAVVSGPGRHYIIVALTNHPKGDDYLVDFARAVDALLTAPISTTQ